MHVGELDFDFPEELIAQYPAEPRDSCRLMYLPAMGRPRHLRFSDLPGLLREGDTVVFNDSRVLPARLEAYKPTGGRVELLFLRPMSPEPPSGNHGVHSAPRSGSIVDRGEVWEVLAKPSHRLRPGGRLLLPGGEELLLRTRLGDGRWEIEGPAYASLVGLMESYGRLPLPPYIRAYAGDPAAYQTVYADRLGSAAAPTAGLHFTPGTLEALGAAGVVSAYVTLHVGLDTFQPIREQTVEDHPIHREAYSLSPQSLAAIRETRVRGGRLVAVGTTAARVLETLTGGGLLDAAAELLAPGQATFHREVRGPALGKDGLIHGTTGIFITPGYRFRAVDVLLTNLHLPRSTVLALVMAFAGGERIRDSYREAIASGYRFFSFGDAMLIEPAPDGRSCEDVSQSGGSA